MGKMDDTRAFLQAIGMPKAQLADICCLSLLALAGVREETPWSQATNEWLRIHNYIMPTSRLAFISEWVNAGLFNLR